MCLHLGCHKHVRNALCSEVTTAMTSLDDRQLSAATQFHEDTVACAVVDQKVVTWHSLLCSGMRNYGSNKLERVVPETRLRGRTWGQDVTLAVPTTEPTVVAVTSSGVRARLASGWAASPSALGSWLCISSFASRSGFIHTAL